MQVLPSSSGLGETIAAVQLDTEGRIVDITEEAASMIGFAPDALRGLSLGDLAAEQWRMLADGATARVLLGDSKPFQLLLRGKSGRRTLVQMVSRRVVHEGETTYVLAWSEQIQRTATEPNRHDAPGLRRLAYGLLRTQEKERSRVAADLHSGVAPLVVMAKFMVEDAMGRVHLGAYAQSVALLSAVVDRLRDVLHEVRRISTDLRPSMLDDLGLLPTIEWFCRTFEETYSSICVERLLAVTEADVPDQLKLDIFRIVQELLTNVAQHAHASHVRVALARDAGELKLYVEDDGVGFDPAPYFSGEGFTAGVGLPSIRRRVEATAGQVVFESRPNGETLIGAIWAMPLRAPG